MHRYRDPDSALSWPIFAVVIHPPGIGIPDEAVRVLSLGDDHPQRGSELRPIDSSPSCEGQLESLPGIHEHSFWAEENRLTSPISATKIAARVGPTPGISSMAR